MASIAQILRRAVVEHAQGRCEHCGTAQAIVVEREVNYPCVLDSSGSVGSLGSFFNPWDDRPIGRVHTGILATLLDAGYIPVIEPTAFALFGDDDALVLADDVAAAIASALDAARALFFHPLGGVPDPKTRELFDQLTAAEALGVASDARTPEDLRSALRAAATSVRAGVSAAAILDGGVAHASIIELLTPQHIGTRVTSGIVLAA